MNRNLYTFFSFFILGMFLPELVNAQEQDKVWFDGAARSFFARDAVGEIEFPDTTSSINSSSGIQFIRF